MAVKKTKTKNDTYSLFHQDSLIHDAKFIWASLLVLVAWIVQIIMKYIPPPASFCNKSVEVLEVTMFDSVFKIPSQILTIEYIPYLFAIGLYVWCFYSRGQWRRAKVQGLR